MAGYRTLFVPVIVASIAISSILQWLADSGEPHDFIPLILKVTSGVVAYSSAFLLLRRRVHTEWKLLILVAFIGTLINSALTTATDAFYSLRPEYWPTMSGFSDWAGLWLTTLLGRAILAPMFTVLFLSVAFPVYGLMVLVGRISRPTSKLV